ncbi:MULTISPECIES: hypothetical protein [unclassified Coleofasciculus]|uniref:hypothetical protein n=1 Tax=unclassified Coleofasciculus TaxID=2692782 RepID=UPI001882A805|nr:MULTISPECIES: hypothetical protein [unclassified Coleofasciculus]MBE9128585.1 hypothetical protein [Coleofasciculus sp. LEGE 07081]MBE9147920.1 hypothetical protein [Coleofasciculus sp. LEGE 07092]
MDAILMLILEAFLVWIVEKSADRILTWVMKRLTVEKKGDHEIHLNPESPQPAEHPGIE